MRRNAMEYKIYAVENGGNVVEYASFPDDGYAKQIEEKIEKKRKEGKSDNADVVMREVFAKKRGVEKRFFKTAMRALRRYDEVGLSNDIYDVLEEIADDGGYEAVLFENAQNVKESHADLSDLEI